MAIGPDIPPTQPGGEPWPAEDLSTASNYVASVPTSGGESIYPFNKVRRTLSGHQFEEDDTLGRERIKMTHTSGTSQEFTPDGSRILMITGDDYTVIVGNGVLQVNGNLNIVVNGECNITSNENMNLTANGDMNVRVKGDRRTRIDGNDYLDVTGDVCANVGENNKVIVNGEYEEKIKGQMRSEVYGDAYVSWYGQENTQWTSKKLTQFVGNKYTITGGEIDLRGCGNLPAELDAEGKEKFPLRNDVMGGLKKSPGISLTSGTGMMMATGLDIHQDDKDGNPTAVDENGESLTGTVKYESGTPSVDSSEDIKANVMAEVQEAKQMIGDSDNKIYIPSASIEMSMGGISCTGTTKHAGITTTFGNIQSGAGMCQTAARLVSPLFESEHLKCNLLEAGMIAASDISTVGDVLAGGKWKKGGAEYPEPIGSISLRGHRHDVPDVDSGSSTALSDAPTLELI